MRRWFLLMTLLVSGCAATAQPFFRLGFSIAAGTHVNRVGAFAEYAYYFDALNVYDRINLYYAFKSIGAPQRGWELQNQTGFNVGWGSDQKHVDERVADSRKQFAAGYSYNVYLDQRRTSQVTGSINLQLSHVLLSVDNDLFAHGYFDRFRTGAMRIGYLDSNVYAGLQLILWTGQHNGGRIVDSTYPGRYGYVDWRNGRYGSYAAGIASAFVQYRAGTATAMAACGVDAEQIRDAVQNKFLHDMPFLPRRWKKHPNAHIPMVARDGTPYLYQFGQRVRPAEPYLQLSLNDTGMY